MAITRQYQRYLNSPQWKVKRLNVLRRDKFLCQKCKKQKATQVHHKHYRNIFNEPLGDLMAVCAICHRNIHGIKKKRTRRIFGGLGKVLVRVIG